MSRAFCSLPPSRAVAAITMIFLCGIAGQLWTVRPADGLRILAVETIAGKSHWNFMRNVLRALTDSGHTVTVFTPFPDGDRANYTEVDMSTTIPIKLNMDLAEILDKFVAITSLVPFSVQISKMLCNIIFTDDRMLAVLQRDSGTDDFDVIIVEPLGSDCVSYMATRLNLPMIYVIPSPMITHFERAFLGHVPNPATTSHMFARYAVPRSFAQRFTNTVMLAYTMFSVAYNDWSLSRADPRPYDDKPFVRPAAVFVNSHYITEQPSPTLPNVVQVGGVHLEHPKGIPHDILEFIEGSPNGVIYFTFGSVVKMSTLPDYIQGAFKEALARVPQRVLWKYEGEMENVPKNVMIKKWFPQRDILMHPKVKLFIGHGGISGVYETVDAGVPVLGFPMFYDQHRNVANLVDAGMAISMELLSVSEDALLNAILKLVNNETYAKNAKIASVRFKDRPMSPEKSIVYWTEYVHRHKGAPQLKSHALTLTWYQYYLLDVISTILMCVFITLFAIYYTLKTIYKYGLSYLQNVKSKSE